MDEKMKILYALSFMHGGIAQVWAKNETNVVLSQTSMFSTLMELLAGIERTFRDPDQERIVHTQLHALEMMTGMMADEYMAKVQVQDAHRKNQLQQGATGGCIHPGPPSPNSFQGLLSSFITIRLGQLEDCHPKYGPPPSGIHQAEAVNPSDLNADPLDADPSHHPHSRHLCTHGY